MPALHHRLLIEHLEAVERGDIERLMVCMPPGSAKALALDTPIPTPSGWSTMGSLAVGDAVFDERGLPCKVTWKSPVWKSRPVYRVTTDCGDQIIADRDHEWLVRLCGKRDVYKIKETHELCRSRAKRPMIRRAGAIELPDADLQIDPYLLGLWLGDGTSASLSITAAAEDEQFYRREMAEIGVETSDRAAKQLFGVLGQRAKFVALGLVHDPAHKTYGRKHIPVAYLRGSCSQRLALLQGLIDSDGSVCRSRGSTTFSNTNHELACQVQELVRSLGVKAGMSVGRAKIGDMDCGPYYRVSFYLKDSARLPRKATLTRDQQRTPNTYIDVEFAGLADTVCIEVDSPSHLFLCGRSMTPTHNSTYTSVEFPAWFMGRNPGLSIIAASHTQELAERFGRRVRNIVASDEFSRVYGFGVADDSASAGRWDTQKGGEYFAAGVGGSITGRRADLAVIDDPVKSREDADSERSRQKAWEWYTSDLLTRLKPGARQIVVMTRWHEDDLGGRILERERDRWTLIEIAMEALPGDPLKRKVGERLWPEWFTDDMVSVAKMDPRAWNALYQQQPASEDGDYFKREWLEQEYETLPQNCRKFGTSDYGVTEGGGDYTEHGIFATDATGNLYIDDWWRGQAAADTWIDEKCSLILTHSPQCWFGEAGPIRRAVEPFMKRRMMERGALCRVEWLPSVSDKPSRARSFQALCSMRKVYIRKNLPHKADLIGQLLRFPAGKHDDGVDVCGLIGRGLAFIGSGAKPMHDFSKSAAQGMKT